MRRNVVRWVAIVLATAWLTLAGGCARPPATGVTSIKATSQGELRSYLLDHKADVDQFRLRGPFAVTPRENLEFKLATGEHVVADLYLAAPAEKAPLAVLVHGQDNSKESHAYQAQHLATWGMHALSVQLPNNGPWIRNGAILGKLVELVQRRPELLDRRIDVGRIVLVGHSFGGTAAAVALAEGAPAVGAVMLDPAGIGRDLPKYLDRVRVPVMVLGADEHVGATRNRGYFFRFIRGGVAELSIRDATHEDAEYPSEHGPQFLSTDAASEESQITFVSALTAAALSLSFTGKLDYAWASYGDALADGRFFNPRKK